MNLSEIVKIIQNKLSKILWIQIIVSVSVVLVTLQMPNKYSSTLALLISEKSNQSISSVLGNIPLLGQSSAIQEVELAKYRLSSVSFFNETVYKNDDLAKKVCATNGFDKSTKKLTYDDGLIGSDSKWIKKVPLQECHEVFSSNFNISLERSSGIMILEYTSYSPIFSKYLLEIIASEYDQITKNIDLRKLTDSNEYLKEELSNSSNVELRTIISSAIQKNIEQISLLNSRSLFNIEIIDGPFLPEKKSAPSRSTICIIVFLISLIFSIAFFLINEKKQIFRI